MRKLIKSADSIKSKRVIIREALDDIAKEVGSRLQEEGLDIPVFLSVPGQGGRAILTLATPSDPNEGDWWSVSVIVCEIAGKQLDNVILRGLEIRSAIANVERIKVAEVTAD